jgi:hypothetical protein
MSYVKYCKQVQTGTLPAGFDQWNSADKNGWTLAHEAALGGLFFDNPAILELADSDGWTVAHVAAQYASLPDTFTGWELSDHLGRTVASIAVYNGELTDNFDRWGIVGSDGITVLSRFLSLSRPLSFYPYRRDKFIERWYEEKPLCKTEADWEVFKIELPEIYQKYTVSECMLDVDNAKEASQEALQGALQGALL